MNCGGSRKTAAIMSKREQMTNANVTAEQHSKYSNKNTVNNQRKQNEHLGIKEDVHSLFGYIGSV